mmetsp:Transcript_14232/g.32306  ORF Transcript_14232/g.32306 Transcript_14232/m.32306 type:complete len:812 (+) Transcript_14232:139-2574(+)
MGRSRSRRGRKSSSRGGRSKESSSQDRRKKAGKRKKSSSSSSSSPSSKDSRKPSNAKASAPAKEEAKPVAQAQAESARADAGSDVDLDEIRNAPWRDKEQAVASVAGGGAEASAKPAKPEKPPQLVKISLQERPFGMAPTKDGASGYTISKVADDKPAGRAGVQAGWRLVAVGGKACKDADMEAIQGFLKSASLPVALEFEKPAAEESDDSDEEEEDGVKKKRGDEGTLDQRPDLPVDVEGADEENWGGPMPTWENGVQRGILTQDLVSILKKEGLKRPTQVQRHVIPCILHKGLHYDVVASAETGSGKTFAFIIPIVQGILSLGEVGRMRPFFQGTNAQGMPMAMLLSPTRELAIQTDKELQRVFKTLKFRTTCVYGGEPLKVQCMRFVDKQTDVVCGTPGRMLDIIDQGRLSLSYVQRVVIDEADQMLEQQGLDKIVKELMNGRDLPPKGSDSRQTMLFSATFKPAVQEICKKVLRPEPNFVYIRIGHYTNDKGGSVAHIKQTIVWAPDDQSRMHAFCTEIANIHQERIRQALKNGATGVGVRLEDARCQQMKASNTMAYCRPGSPDFIQAERACQEAVHKVTELEAEFRKENPDLPVPAVPKPGTCNAAGYPIRPGCRPCEYYMKTGSCAFGPKCNWDHPDKPDLARPLGGGIPPCRIVAFSNRRVQAEMITAVLRGRGIYTDHLHGKLEQWQREEAVESFQKTDFGVMIATNVAARGLDFDDTRFVFQLDLADSIDTYTHRIGRTGRIGNEGTAIGYMGEKDAPIAKPLVELLRLNDQPVPPWLVQFAAIPVDYFKGKGKGKGKWKW